MTLPYKILSVILIGLALFGFGYTKGRRDVKADYVEQERNALIEYAAKIKQAGEQHDEDQATITRLAADARRVRIHIPTCPTASEDQNGEAGVLSGRVDDLFGELQARTTDLIQRCDQLNIDAIRTNHEIGK